MLTIIARLLKALNSHVSPNQLALAVCFALLLGITPLTAPLNALLVFLLLILRINLTLFLVSWGLFTLIAYLADPLSHNLGLQLLNAEGLNGLWQSMYNSSVWRLLGFNNTLILGSTVLCLLLLLPLFFVSRFIVIEYRQHILSWVQQSKLGLWLKGGKVYGIYQSLYG